MKDCVSIALGGKKHPGMFAMVDDEDVSLVGVCGWRPERSRYGAVFYARKTTYIKGGSPVVIRMHRLILGAPPGVEVDHINGNGLDNRRANLRIVTHAQNQQNRHALTKNTSGCRGVTFHRVLGMWQAQIRFEGR